MLTLRRRFSTGTELGALTLGPGVYNANNGDFGINGTLTLDGQSNTNAVFIFQMASTLITAASSQVVLISCARWSNIFWQVGSSATLGANSTLEGSILANVSITGNSYATAHGRLLAGAVAPSGAVILDNNTALPVEIVSFTATANRLSCELLWTTATELNNHPNPFPRSTTIEFALARAGMAVVKVYNIHAQEVASLYEGIAEAGRLYQVRFDASQVPYGMYFVRLNANGQTRMQKIVYLK
ncbi:MAG: ice-binding family protein [Bacteroidota bacterium]